MKLKYAKLSPAVKTPVRKHENDAGVDVAASCTVIVPPLSNRVIPTGLVFEIPEGYMLSVWPRGRHSHMIGAGVGDTGYIGEMKVKVVNYTLLPMVFHKGQSVAQFVLTKIDTPPLLEVQLSDLLVVKSERGKSGGIHESK